MKVSAPGNSLSIRDLTRGCGLRHNSMQKIHDYQMCIFGSARRSDPLTSGIPKLSLRQVVSYFMDKDIQTFISAFCTRPEQHGTKHRGEVSHSPGGIHLSSLMTWTLTLRI
jgi:hypothetical protein